MLLFLIALISITIGLVLAGYFEVKHRVKKHKKRNDNILIFETWLEDSVVENTELQYRTSHYDASRKL